MSNRLKSIKYGGKSYTVGFKQTRKWSHSSMKKIALVHHATGSNSYKGGLSWLVDGYDPKTKTYGNGGSALLIIGRNVGEIKQLGELNQKLWHAGRINQPNDRFLAIAKRSNTLGKPFVNPNLYTDGVEYVGGVDIDKDGKVETSEVNLTEWQYACAEQIARWHAIENGYPLEEKSQLIHQDIAIDKPDLSEILEELFFRLFHKKHEDVSESKILQKKVELQKTLMQLLIQLIKRLIKIKK